MRVEEPDSKAVRDAIAAEEFSRALELWDDYAGTLRGELSTGRLTEARLAEARELVEWARQTVLAMRAHGQQRLDLLCAVQKYDEHLPDTGRMVRTAL